MNGIPVFAALLLAPLVALHAADSPEPIRPKVVVIVTVAPGAGDAGCSSDLSVAPSQDRAKPGNRFPYYLSEPVQYFNVRLADTFWAPRQRTIQDISVPWATRHYDGAGGLDAYRKQPNGYQARAGAAESIKFIEAMAVVVGLRRKVYLHGAGGTYSGNNEGYTTKPYYIPPTECYGESCSVFGNFQWTHNLFRLTGDARYLDMAERMLYNAFYASLSLSGDRFFYENPAEVRQPTPRHEWHGCPCCPPNIVKLFAKVGGFLYSTDKDGIFVKQYGASTADIPFAKGVKLTQRTDYPWNGEITIQVDPAEACRFVLRLRLPAWAKSHSLAVNGNALSCSPERGWLTVSHDWKAGDVVKLSLPMEIELVSVPEEFREYKGLVALRRGPIVYCLEGQGNEWKPVPDAGEFGTKADTFNTVAFTPVTTDSLRMEVQSQPQFSTSILKWKVK